MARGFLTGVIAGTLVSGLGLGGASLLVGPPEAARPEASTLEVPAGSEFNQSREDTEAALPDAVDSPGAGDAPQVSAPEPDTTSALEAADTTPAAQPEAGQDGAALSAPQSGAGDADVAVDGESPVLPSPQALPPTQPASEDEVAISTDPAQPVLPEAEESAFPGIDAPVEAVDAPATEAPAPEPEEATPSEPETALLTEPEAQEAPEAESPAELEEEAAAPSSTIGNLAEGVTTNRLPSVGDPEDETDGDTAEDAAVEGDIGAAPDLAPDAESLPPLQRFAVEFDNPEAKPLMSIILIDDGSSPVGFEALESFPYPLTFAVDVAWQGADEAMRAYRAAGFEVMAMVDLPEGAGAQDAEVAFQAIFARLPEVVGVIEGTQTGLQASRDAAGQLAPILLDSGHGAVFFPKGLNTAQQLLAREGVPSVTVFRDFDANGQNATVIRRFLDQAAFKAAQEDAGVVMVGRLRADTVSALLLWGLQDRASRVTLAPISALLLGK